MLGSKNLTPGYADLELVRQTNKSVPGMAHFAASGPFGETCQRCAFFGYHRKITNKAGDTVRTVFKSGCCRKFFELTGKHGDPIPPRTESCHYLVARKT
jgi:hypothetical protein